MEAALRALSPAAAAAAPWAALDHQGRTPEAVATTLQVIEVLQRTPAAVCFAPAVVGS